MGEPGLEMPALLEMKSKAIPGQPIAGENRWVHL